MSEAHIPAEVQRSILILAPLEHVWSALTQTHWMEQWMSKERLEIEKSEQVGDPFILRGDLHGFQIENTGTLLAYEAPHHFAYSHLSSLSELPDQPQNYCHLHFHLTALPEGTHLDLFLRQFATDSIYKHLLLYWNATLHIFKAWVESHQDEIDATLKSRL